jgi:hypothetical protein
MSTESETAQHVVTLVASAFVYALAGFGAAAAVGLLAVGNPLGSVLCAVVVVRLFRAATDMYWSCVTTP